MAANWRAFAGKHDAIKEKEEVNRKDFMRWSDANESMHVGAVSWLALVGCRSVEFSIQWSVGGKNSPKMFGDGW